VSMTNFKVRWAIQSSLESSPFVRGHRQLNWLEFAEVSQPCLGASHGAGHHGAAGTYCSKLLKSKCHTCHSQAPEHACWVSICNFDAIPPRKSHASAALKEQFPNSSKIHRRRIQGQENVHQRLPRARAQQQCPWAV
jgi:hypothetical protein